MRKRLAARDYDEADIEAVVEQLKSDSYLSEVRFAESYLRSRLNKGEAPWLAAQRAKQKGVDHSVLQNELDRVEADFDAGEAAARLLAARDPSGLRFEDERVWQRQARFLRNKGFNSDTILRVLNQRAEGSR